MGNPDPVSFISADCDVSPSDNSKTQKEGVSRTYKLRWLCTYVALHWNGRLCIAYTTSTDILGHFIILFCTFGHFMVSLLME
jgi:hypothetical protein